MAQTQQANIAAAFLRLTQASNTLAARVGPLTSLSTQEKGSLVAALNEVRAAIPTLTDLIDDAAASTSTTWSSAKIQERIASAITAMISGADGASDTLKELADQIVALTQADQGLLSFNAPQELTPGQQAQACSNLGIGDPAHDFVPAIEAALSSGL